MPPRRSHLKSRNGCDQCRQRRVKCDENGPPCLNCTNRQLECTYTKRDLIQTHRGWSGRELHVQSPESAASDQFYSARASPKSVIEEDSNQRLRELELMHHWCTKTCYSFASKGVDIFQGYVVKVALQHDYLMDAILALTCLHMSSEVSDTTTAATYINHGLQYQNKSLANYRTVIQNVNPTNCDAVFACALVSMVCAIVSPLLGDNELSNSPTESILVMFNFLLGIGSVIDISRQWLEAGPFKDLLEPPIDAPNPNEGMQFQLQQLKTLNKSTIIQLKYQLYNQAIESLETALTINRTMAIPWLSMVGIEFLNDLRKKEPIPLIIFLYWGVSLDKLDGMWWAKISGKKIVLELSTQLKGYGDDWENCINWARKEVGL